MNDVLTDFLTLFAETNIGTVGSLLAVLFAVISLLQSRVTARKQQSLESEGLLLQLNTSLQAWAEECIEEIALLQHFLWQNDRKRVEMQLTCVSALIDKGRLFLPNEGRKPDLSDVDKHEAYQGDRPKLLEDLFQIYDYVRKLEEAGTEYAPEHATEVFRRRRIFVAELTSRLQTKRRRSIEAALSS